MAVAPVKERQDAPESGAQASHNAGVWSRGEFVAHYDHGGLVPAEAILLARHRASIGGRVLDVGCGAGRVLAYLRLLSDDVHGVDLSPVMVAHCRERHPDVEVHEGDLRNLPATEVGPYDAILIPDNTLDVFDDAERRRVLADLHALLAPGGLLIVTAHNLDCWDRLGGEPMYSRKRRSFIYVRDVIRRRDGSRLRTALRPLIDQVNRRRLAPRQSRAADHAIINDSSHQHSLLHYYIGAEAQRAQLEQTGFEVIEVLELDGSTIAPGEAGRSLWLHYAARAV